MDEEIVTFQDDQGRWHARHPSTDLVTEAATEAEARQKLLEEVALYRLPFTAEDLP